MAILNKRALVSHVQSNSPQKRTLLRGAFLRRAVKIHLHRWRRKTSTLQFPERANMCLSIFETVIIWLGNYGVGFVLFVVYSIEFVLGIEVSLYKWNNLTVYVLFSTNNLTLQKFCIKHFRYYKKLFIAAICQLWIHF